MLLLLLSLLATVAAVAVAAAACFDLLFLLHIFLLCSVARATCVCHMPHAAAHAAARVRFVCCLLCLRFVRVIFAG